MVVHGRWRLDPQLVVGGFKVVNAYWRDATRFYVKLDVPQDDVIYQMTVVVSSAEPCHVILATLWVADNDGEWGKTFVTGPLVLKSERAVPRHVAADTVHRLIFTDICGL